jgi:exonuclease VII large subunit
MQKIIAILLITLVSSNTIIENNLKLRKTAEIELGQILDEIKEYFEKGLKNVLEYCEKITKHFEKNKIEKNLSELTNFLKDLKEKLQKYKFDELIKKIEDYLDKFKFFIINLKPEILIDFLLNYFNKIREFFSINYFEVGIEKKIIVGIRRSIAQFSVDEIESGIHRPYIKLLEDLESFDINKFIKDFIRSIEEIYRDYSKDKFKNNIRITRKDFYRDMERLLKNIHEAENEFSVKIIRMKEELSGIQFNEDLKRKFSEAFEQIQKYINNLDNEKVFKFVKFFIETFINQITTKNLDSSFKTIKSYIEKLKDYLYENIYKNIIEFYDNSVTEIKKLTDTINPESIQNKIEKFIKKIKDYFKSIDTVEFIKQVDKVFDKNLNYILKFDFQSPIHKFFQNIIKIRNVFNELGCDFIINVLNIVVDYANFLYESLPREYKKGNQEIYGEGFYI